MKNIGIAGKYKGIMFILTIILLLISASVYFRILNDDKETKIISSPTSWKIMIYVAGDNSLSDFTSQYNSYVNSIGSSEEIKIISLLDGRLNDDTLLQYHQSHESETFPLNLLSDNYENEMDMSSPLSLKQFINWSIKNYPTTYNCLIIWGHGVGWQGVAQDKEKYMEINDLNNVLESIVKHNTNNKIDILGFDACDMGMLEVCYEVKDNVDIVVASEKEEPMSGWPYYDILKQLKSEPSLTPKKFSQIIVDEYNKAYSTGQLEDEGLSTTLSAIDLRKIDDVVENLEFKSTKTHLIESYENPEYVDLYHYAEINGNKELMNSIKDCVISSKHWSNPEGQKIEYAKGLTIYFPKSYDPRYKELQFAKDTDWDEGIKYDV